MALRGMGIALKSEFMTAADVAAGHLVPVMEDVSLPATKPVNAVFYEQSAVSARIASMVDYLKSAMDAPEHRWASGG